MSGFVYVIQDSNGLCKIGRAKDVDKRLRALSTAASSDLTIIAAWPCSDPGGFENMLHRAWARVRARGEWSRIPTATIAVWRTLNGRAELTIEEFQSFLPHGPLELANETTPVLEEPWQDMPGEDGAWWVCEGVQRITCPQCKRETDDFPGVMRYRRDFDFRGIQARCRPDWPAFGWLVWRQCAHCSWMDFRSEFVTTKMIRDWKVGPWRPMP